ncbi:MAG TPA: hypothetical protein DD658_11555 [Deltaproteobacteria bacterium]|nr:MAG: hypothetical protein A2X88_00745 [Deltaproteobacteria bacterium GWC2_65_14]HBO70704.1 hypothetical protein [Deltaproteobacteria bacterium]
MRKENPIGLRLLVLTIVLTLPVCIGSLFPEPCEAGGPFASYAESVRARAEKVVAAAGPGKEEELGKQVRLLRKEMHAYGILSLNSVADLVYEKAVGEGWKRDGAPFLRAVADVAPLSVPMWAWLVKEDLLGGRMQDLVRDFDGMVGAVRRFGPALLGYASWLISFLAAAVCWFAVWASIALFLRARPSLESDIGRFFRFPGGGYLSVLAAAALFLLPLFAGFGLAIAACIWLALSAAYLRRAEILMMTSVILLLAALLAGGSVLHSLKRLTGEVQRGGWLGTEGYFPEEWPDASYLPMKGEERAPISRLVRFSRGRAAMMAGKAAEAEKIWTELVSGGGSPAGVLNNRGIARAQQGRLEEALADFEEALRKAPGDGATLWNAYQAYLRLFNLERSRALQPEAWEKVQAMAPYNLRPAEMEQGEWIASPLNVGDIWKSFFALRGDWIREAGESDIFRLYFRPLSATVSLVFLALVWLIAGAWKVLSMKVWVNRTCRGCGVRTLIVGSREAHEFCNQCRSRIAGASNDTGEPDRRGQGIAMHTAYVRACSVLVPGSGWLWSGKEIRTMVYGILLSLSLGLLSSSIGALDGGTIVADLERTVTFLAIGLAAVLWLAGSVAGLRSFRKMQRELGILPAGR